jgi:hypothetical protein
MAPARSPVVLYEGFYPTFDPDYQKSLEKFYKNEILPHF